MIYTREDLGRALAELRSRGALNAEAFDALRATVSRDAPELLGDMERLLRGESLPGLPALTDREKQAISTPAPMTTIQALIEPGKTKIQSKRRAWAFGDLPMAGPKGWFQPTLWEKGGPLDKLEAATQTTGALAHERKSALSFLVGEEGGHHVPDLFVDERNAMSSTGIDFLRQVADPGDLPWAPGTDISADFVSEREPIAGLLPGEKWVAVTKRDHKPVKVTIKSVEIRGKTYAQPVYEGLNRKDVMLVLLREDGSIKGDGHTDRLFKDFAFANYLGNCDSVTGAALLFEEPKHAVKMNGVVFSPSDIKALLAAAVRGVGEERRMLLGGRFEDELDIIVTKDGVLFGTLEGVSSDDLRAHPFSTAEDSIISRGIGRDIVIDTGGEKKKIPASDVLAIVHEERQDIDAAQFLEFALTRLRGNQPFGIDVSEGLSIANKAIDGVSVRTHRKKNRDEVKLTLLRDGDTVKSFKLWIERDKNGHVLKSGWIGKSPDFVWEQAGDPLGQKSNPSNPFIDTRVVAALYKASIKGAP